MKEPVSDLLLAITLLSERTMTITALLTGRAHRDDAARYAQRSGRA
jgi:hypothetical protein